MVDDFVLMVSQYKVMTDELIRLVSREEWGCTDDMIVEISKLNVNCYITSEYIVNEMKHIEVDEHGVLKTNPTQEANLVKCVRSIMDSKKYLSASNVSLEMHL